MDDHDGVVVEAQRPDMVAPDTMSPVANKRTIPFFYGGLLIFVGVGMLSVVVVLEATWLRDVIWANALMVFNDGTMPEGALPVFLRELPPPDDETIQEIRQTLLSQQMIEEEIAVVVKNEIPEVAGDVALPDTPVSAPKLPYSFHEHLISLELDAKTWQGLLGEGRIPTPGQAEVLAGDLCQQDQITLDGVTFNVVGHLKIGVSAMNMAYLLPQDPQWDDLFSDTTKTDQGWLHPEGLTQAEDLMDMENVSEEVYAVGGSRTWPVFHYVGVIALLLIAIGGSIAHMAIFRRLAEADTGLIKPLLLATQKWHQLFYWCHVFYFGVFLIAMIEGIAHPVWGMRLAEYLGQAFTEGDLAYIGEAYSSGNYLQAAAATWWNNYVMQTLLLTFGISLVPLGAGLLKTLFSFVMTGFVMAPVLVGSAGGYSYHSITMILELEAYIVACFAVMLWMLHVYRALTSTTPFQELLNGARIMLGGVVLTGIMLGIAGIYEAVTLIVFSQN